MTDLYGFAVLYALILLTFFAISNSRTRRYLRKQWWYKVWFEQLFEKHLNKLVIFRQILLFLSPLCLGIPILVFATGASLVLNQLAALVALGLSLVIFWVVEVPLLTKADIIVTFGVDDGNYIPEDKYFDRLLLVAEKENIVNTRIHNKGFSTLKNGRIEIYFGDGFEVLPFEHPRYRNLDFPKKFSIMKANCGVIFSPMDNFQTLAPQEVFTFQTIVRPSRKIERDKVSVHFASENSWGVKEIISPMDVITEMT